MSAVQQQLLEYRAVRAELERSVLALAHSIDGRHFEWQWPVVEEVPEVGGYVALETGDRTMLGQVLDAGVRRVDASELAASDGNGGVMRATVSIRVVAGSGVVLDGQGRSFNDARVRPATDDEVRGWGERGHGRRARLPVGTLLTSPSVRCTLDAGGFGRHTFLCGQSGSCKTYALGVVLERLLAETRLRIVVLDPNSDFVRLHQVRDGAAAADAARHQDVAAGIVVRTAGVAGPDRLHLRFGELSAEAQAAVLRLDPIADREEYATLAAAVSEIRPTAIEALATSEVAGARQLAQRAGNLGVADLGAWSRGDTGSVLEDLTRPEVRCLVVDLGSLPTRTEQALVAEAVLATLWRRRADRSPVLIVVDEAHNVCPAEPPDALTALATEHVTRIAAEGRKFGLYLLVSTQRPQKLPENVISQCDNLLLMRLNSRADAAFAQDVFSFVPAGLLGRAPSFGLGEALVAGRISPDPALLRFGARVAEEGGADVPATWAAGPSASGRG